MTKLIYDAPIYEEHLTPNGTLPRDKALTASAAWHFTRLAMAALEKIPEQVAYEGEVDLTVRLRQIAESVMVQYNIKDIESMMNLMPAVRTEAFRVSYPWNDRLQAWLDSGGRAYDSITREEGRLNQS